jgi:hypothetical protein
VLFFGQAPFEFDRQLESGQLRLFTGMIAEDQAAAAAASADLTAAPAAASLAVDGREVTVDFQEALQQVQSAGPCVVFVPLWSLAAGEAHGSIDFERKDMCDMSVTKE